MNDILFKVISKMYEPMSNEDISTSIEYHKALLVRIFDKMIPEEIDPSNYKIRTRRPYSPVALRINIDFYNDDKERVSGIEVSIHQNHILKYLYWTQIRQINNNLYWNRQGNLTKKVSSIFPWEEIIKAINEA